MHIHPMHDNAFGSSIYGFQCLGFGVTKMGWAHLHALHIYDRQDLSGNSAIIVFVIAAVGWVGNLG